jgi:hypothetical protein
MIENVLKWMGAADEALTVMGPILTIALSFLFGGAVAQFLKFWFARLIPDDGLYNWCVRASAVVSTTIFAHYLSDTLSLAVEFGLGFAQIGAYHAFRSSIRRWAPWLEVSPMVGSVVPPIEAVEAAAARAASKK